MEINTELIVPMIIVAILGISMVAFMVYVIRKINKDPNAIKMEKK